jgi:hypothetical protein
MSSLRLSTSVAPARPSKLRRDGSPPGRHNRCMGLTRVNTLGIGGTISDLSVTSILAPLCMTSMRLYARWTRGIMHAYHDLICLLHSSSIPHSNCPSFLPASNATRCLSPIPHPHHSRISLAIHSPFYVVRLTRLIPLLFCLIVAFVIDSPPLVTLQSF